MQAYNKLWAAIVGVTLMVIHDQFGVDLTGEAATIVDLGIKIATAIGVYAVPNKEGA